MAESKTIFRPALIVVDMQEDFCPPNGSLPVPSGRTITPLINSLLALPSFVLRIGTKDWHPPNHISFASNHPGKSPFTDTCIVTNPYNPAESYETRLWPDHCVQHSPGAELIPELEVSRLDKVIEKGTDPRVEMYSAFYDPLKNPRVSDSGLAAVLREAEVTHVFVVGLAGDYCVKCTATDAHAEGFTTYVVDEGTKAVDAAGWEACKAEIQGCGVSVVSKDGPEVRRLLNQTGWYPS
ncbi:Isochorismatase-like protein [Immersiella caudata]|uniref:nicotinamidase n=1 Tax=Immersiella caudata TaxID=314043 RepID=A0AA40CCS2_9PEZI|nr:Isochorismatase-like protein [Immersiella caudata]